MMKVKQSKTTEKTVVAEGKERYDLIMKELSELSLETDALKNEVFDKNAIFTAYKAEKIKPNEENEKAF